MSFSSPHKLVLQQWVAGLASDIEVDAVCRVLIENGHGTELLPQAASAVPGVIDATTEGNAGIMSLV